MNSPKMTGQEKLSRGKLSPLKALSKFRFFKDNELLRSDVSHMLVKSKVSDELRLLWLWEVTSWS